MEDALIEFTNATKVEADALGEPGERTFRITVDSGNSSALIWLEKEQLFQLALAVQQMLGTLPDQPATDATPPVEREAPDHTNLEFKVGKISLGHDNSHGMFVIDAYRADEDDDSDATFRLWLRSDQAKDLSEQAMRVCSAGRPLCPLCGGPIDQSGHNCPRANGHTSSLDF